MRWIAFVSSLFLTLACDAPPASPPETTAAPEPTTVAPAAPVEATVPSADGVPIAYTVTGEGSPAIVFVHCWSCDQSFWEAQVPAFADHYQVVTLDLAGHGASGVERKDWNLPSFGQDVAAVVTALDLPRVVLVGHSIGGPVVVEAARLIPERVVGVIGIDTLHDADEVHDPEQWRQLFDGFERDFAGTCDGFIRQFFPQGTATELVDRTVARLCDAPPEVAIAVLRANGDYDLGAAMGAVEAPIRAINATTYPTDVEANRKVAPGFDVVLMEGVGHFPMLEKPEEFNRVLAEVVGSLDGSAPAGGA